MNIETADRLWHKAHKAAEENYEAYRRAKSNGLTALADRYLRRFYRAGRAQEKYERALVAAGRMFYISW